MPSTTVRRPTTSRLIRGLVLPLIPFLVVVFAVSTIELVGVSDSVRFVLQMTLGIPVFARGSTTSRVKSLIKTWRLLTAASFSV